MIAAVMVACTNGGGGRPTVDRPFRYRADTYAQQQIAETLNMTERINIESYIYGTYIRFADCSRNTERN